MDLVNGCWLPSHVLVELLRHVAGDEAQNVAAVSKPLALRERLHLARAPLPHFRSCETSKSAKDGAAEGTSHQGCAARAAPQELPHGPGSRGGWGCGRTAQRALTGCLLCGVSAWGNEKRPR